MTAPRKLIWILCLLCMLPLFGSAGELTQSTTDPMKIIAYGTPEFTEFVKTAPVSLDKAWDIQLAFYKSNPKEMEYSLYKQSAALYFIIDKYYVYTLIPLVKTKPKGKLLSGIWVNSITGEVKYVDNNTIVEAESFSGWAK